MRAFIVLVFAAYIAAANAASSTFSVNSTVLYQSDEPLRERLGSVEELAAYVKRLETACSAFFASDSAPERLDVVVGLKPDKKVRVWFVSSRRTSQDKELLALARKLEAIPPCAVHSGPVALL